MEKTTVIVLDEKFEDFVEVEVTPLNEKGEDFINLIKNPTNPDLRWESSM